MVRKMKYYLFDTVARESTILILSPAAFPHEANVEKQLPETIK